MNNNELRDTTMISMFRFAIIVLMAFRDLRFLSTVFLAHLIRLIFFSSYPMLLFSIQIPFLKKPGSSDQASRLTIMVVLPCYSVGELIVPSCDDGHGVRVARRESEGAAR